MSNLYRFAYDPDGRLYTMSQAPLSSTLTYFTLDDTTAPTGQAVYDSLSAGSPDYSWSGGRVVQQPVLQVGVANSVAGGVPTRTLAISSYVPVGSGFAAPSSCTLTVDGAEETVALDGTGAATATVALHPSVAGDWHRVRVAAVGCTAWSGDLGTPGVVPVGGHQVIRTGGNAYLVAPTTKGQLRRWLFGVQTDDQLLDAFARLLHEAYAMTGLLAQAVFGVLLPAAQAATYAPVSLSADEQHALADLQASVLPYAAHTLATVYPGGGARDPLYADLVTLAAGQGQAMAAYLQALASLPNLS